MAGSCYGRCTCKGTVTKNEGCVSCAHIIWLDNVRKGGKGMNKANFEAPVKHAIARNHLKRLDGVKL